MIDKYILEKSIELKGVRGNSIIVEGNIFKTPILFDNLNILKDGYDEGLEEWNVDSEEFNIIGDDDNIQEYIIIYVELYVNGENQWEEWVEMISELSGRDDYDNINFELLESKTIMYVKF